MTWDGAEILRALQSSPGAKERASNVAQSFLSHKPFLEQHMPRSKLFYSLPPSLIEPISGFIDNVATYPAGTTIFAEGEVSRGLHCVRSGRVGIYVGVRDGNSGERPRLLQVASMKRGEFFGENSMFSHARRASVVALEDTTLLTINIFQMSLLMSVPAVRLALNRKASSNLTELPLYHQSPSPQLGPRRPH